MQRQRRTTAGGALLAGWLALAVLAAGAAPDVALPATAPGTVVVSAAADGYRAWMSHRPGARCPVRVYLRKEGTGERALLTPTTGPTCAAQTGGRARLARAALAVGHGQAIWTVTTVTGGARTTDVDTASFAGRHDSVLASEIVSADGSGAYVAGVAAAGTTAAYAVDQVTAAAGCSHGCSYSLTGGQLFVSQSGGPTAAVPGAPAASLVAVADGEAAVVQADAKASHTAWPHDTRGARVDVVSTASGAAIAHFTPAGRVVAIALDAGRVVTLVEGSAGGKRVQVNDSATGARLASWAVSSAVADRISVSGERAVLRVRHAIVLLDLESGLRRELVDAGRTPVGLSIDGSKVTWSTTVSGTTVLHALSLPHLDGAMPFQQHYNDTYTGWPVAPLHGPHGIYSAFLNPGCGCPSPYQPHTTGYPVFAYYHGAIDIPVNDRDPQPGHPPGRSHRVYAVEGGRVAFVSPQTSACKGRRVWIGHFGYGHVAATVHVGDLVTPGEQIGWSCLGEWHVHLAEWLITPGGGHIPVNPIRPGGKVGPISDRGKPAVAAIRIYRGEHRVSPRHVRGTIEPIALAFDRFPYVNFRGEPRSTLNVYAMNVTVTRPGGAFVKSHDVFKANTEPAPLKTFYYRPLTTRNVRIPDCATHRLKSCNGRSWIRLWPHGWNTRRLPAGRYVVTVRVADELGHTASRSLAIRVVH